MNSKKDFLYYIVDDQGRSLYVKPDGTVARTPILTELKYTPDGWQEVSVSFGRSVESPGVYRSYTIPIKAVKDGGKIVKYLFATEGIRANYYLVMLKLNRQTDIHEQYAVSKIDFTEFLGDPYGATITMLEGGLVALIKNKGNTPYEIPVDVPEAVTLVNDGIVLQGNISFFVYNGDSLTLLNNHIAALNLVQDDGGTIFGARSAQRVVVNTFTGAVVNATGQNFLQPNIAGNVDINITNLQLKVSWTGGTGVNPTPGIALQMAIRVQEGDNIVSTTVIYNTAGVNNVYGPNITLGKIHTIAGSYSIAAPANAKFYLLTLVTVEGATGDDLTRFDYLTVDEPQIAVDFDSRYPTTKMKVLRPEYVFDQLIKKISDGKYSGSSVPLSTQFKNTVLTSGDGVRSLKGAVIKTTLNDFVKSYYGQHAVNIAVNDSLATMENMQYFFQNNNIVDLTPFGDVANLQWEPMLEYIHSGVNVGCPNQNYDDLNGKNEVNTTFKYETAIAELENVFDAVKVYRSDAYGVEFTRMNLTSKKTTDSKSDNDTFMLDIANIDYTGGLVFSNIVEDTITLPARFQSVFVGTVLTISGTSSNNGTYTVTSVVKGSSITAITVAEAVVPETAITATLLSNEAALNRPIFDAISGLISPESVYNLMLRPTLSLRAHGPYLRSGLDLQDNTNIKFLSADKNAELVTTLNGVTIVDKADVFVGSLGARLFRPVVFTFETQVPINLMDILDLNPQQKYGKVKFLWKEAVYYGFIMAAGQVPQLNPKQTWKLLCAPETNLLPLINS